MILTEQRLAHLIQIYLKQHYKQVHNMIKLIIESLKYANGETENLRIAQGKYKLPTTLKEGYKTLKQEIKWQ